jgi:hypothetical protein
MICNKNHARYRESREKTLRDEHNYHRFALLPALSSLIAGLQEADSARRSSAIDWNCRGMSRAWAGFIAQGAHGDWLRAIETPTNSGYKFKLRHRLGRLVIVALYAAHGTILRGGS